MRWLLLALCVNSPVWAEVYSEADLAVARQLLEQTRAGDGGYDIVADLTTRIGPRLAGSEADARAVDWAMNRLAEFGFDRVWREPVHFPAWSRQYQRVSVVAPVAQRLQALALGFSPATPQAGLEGAVVMFDDIDALRAADAEGVRDRVVFIRNRMARTRDGSGYGGAVQARSMGAAVAAEKGALGLVIRSIGTSTNRFAHTGMMRFDQAVRSLPAVAISNPDADQLERLLELDEPVRLRMEIAAETRQTATGYNVIGEITGARLPEKIVALGAHLDSWDVGTGALDDGAGVAIVTEAARRIVALDRRPDRSIRVILFAAEEIGLWGGRAWAEARRERITDYQLVAESDFGGGRIYGFSAKVAPHARPAITAIERELARLGIEPVERVAVGGPDFIPAAQLGLAAADLYQDGTEYFDYHHTENDTLDKIKAEDLAQNAAAYAVLAWLAAQAPMDFGSGASLIPASAASSRR